MPWHSCRQTGCTVDSSLVKFTMRSRLSYTSRLPPPLSASTKYSFANSSESDPTSTSLGATPAALAKDSGAKSYLCGFFVDEIYYQGGSGGEEVEVGMQIFSHLNQSNKKPCL